MKETIDMQNNEITDSEIKNSEQSLTSILEQQKLDYKLSPAPSI